MSLPSPFLQENRKAFALGLSCSGPVPPRPCAGLPCSRSVTAALSTRRHPADGGFTAEIKSQQLVRGVESLGLPGYLSNAFIFF